MLLGNNQHRPAWVLVGSLLAATCLNIFPMGWLGGYFQPDWVALVLIYWSFREPERVGAGVGWSSGFLLDIVQNGVLGKHALGKTVLGFLANKVSLRFRSYPMWQQCVGVAALIAIETLAHAMIRFLLEEQTLSLARWMTPLASMIMWPLVVVTLNARQRVRGYS